MQSDLDHLINLAIKHKSDKWNNHWFAEAYHNQFTSLRDHKLSLLEIGIGDQEDPQEACATLRMWEEYFPSGIIYGLDKRLNASLSQGRVVTIQGNQSNTELLKEIAARAQCFDIIIDNGSHLTNEVLSTFKTLFPLLKQNGFYSIECLQTSYWPLYGGSSDELNRADTTVGFVKSLVDGLNFQERIAPEYQPNYTDKTIVSMHFYHNLVIIEKGENSASSTVILNNMPRAGCEDICYGHSTTVTRTESNARITNENSHAALLESFCSMQMKPWTTARFSFQDLFKQLDNISVTQLNVFVFEIDGTAVSVRRSAGIQALLDAGHQLESVRRAETYQKLFAEAVAFRPLQKRMTLAVDVGDDAPEHTTAPVFSFQKRAGGINPLLPDMEIVGLSYLEAVTVDPYPFDKKHAKATFAGSTSGKNIITMEDLTSNAIPRIRAARFFKGSERVEFKLPNIVQCETEEVAQRLRDEGYGSDREEWLTAFGNKFLISIDGNGAPCSRPAIALRSNSVLLRYSSPNILYYSSGLTPWLHYIPIDDDEDILTIVSQESEQPGTFQHIAESSRSFADAILTRDAILAYTRRVLERYATIFSN